ncbi:hypothetical protein PHISCL_02563 [Aspergillus sclerotialis]|uniref:Uncharacterized protein n=1 Tax=Aspergillus sclerotialis TaxID=2070753 RepID=A0A3A2ZPI1_9EURO|nr:hypothetical protein PHISCL_02563 [Aspergillus sclerotialis]
MHCNTTGDSSYAPQATSSTLHTGFFETEVPSQSSDDIPSPSNNSQICSPPNSPITNEVSVVIRDPNESLVSSVIQQLVVARANFSVSQSFGQS